MISQDYKGGWVRHRQRGVHCHSQRKRKLQLCGTELSLLRLDEAQGPKTHLETHISSVYCSMRGPSSHNNHQQGKHCQQLHLFLAPERKLQVKMRKPFCKHGRLDKRQRGAAKAVARIPENPGSCTINPSTAVDPNGVSVGAAFVQNAIAYCALSTSLFGDAIAGLTVGLMVVPQGLAYATIAGLPHQYGLYSAFVGVIVYCFFGTAKVLRLASPRPLTALQVITVGPTAIMSLMVANQSKQVDGQTVPANAIMLSLLVGCIQLAIGLLQLG